MSSTLKVGMGTTSLPSGAPALVYEGQVDPRKAMVPTGQGKNLTEWYRKRYRGVVTAERRGDQVLLLFDEGESYGLSRQILAFPDTEREVLIRSWVDHVPKSRILRVETRTARELAFRRRLSDGAQGASRFRPAAILRDGEMRREQSQPG
jgi:hypothetical protein